MRAPVLIWLPRNWHQQCVEDAALWFPLETGGVLMGYWNGNTAVVTNLIGAGPNAVRETHNFEPDQTWQLERIAQHYTASQGRETYLGDWHTHPNAKSGQLSGLDRRVLRAILEKPEARTPRPIMMIVFGTNESWEVAAWLCLPAKRRRLWWQVPTIVEINLRVW
jgi:integrative and conjugative element protein (TIGR02256 family)